MRRIGWICLVALIVPLASPRPVPAQDVPTESAAPRPTQITLNMAAFKGGTETTRNVVFGGDTVEIQFILKEGFAERYVLTPQWVVRETKPLDLGDIVVTGSSRSRGVRGMPKECSDPKHAVSEALDVLDDETKIAGARAELLEKVRKELAKGGEATLALALEQYEKDKAAFEVDLERARAEAKAAGEEFSEQEFSSQHFFEEMSAADLKAELEEVFVDCVDQIKEEFEEQTTLVTEVYELHRDVDFSLGIQHTTPKGVVVTRTVLVPAPPSKEWRTMYGFAFASDRDESFFTEPIAGQTDKFKIREKDGTEDFDYNPFLAFVWHRPESKWNFLGGLGLDLKTPLIFAGIQRTFHENFGAFVAAGFQQRRVLDGKYHADEEIGTALDNDQLTVETYSPNVFLGFSLRLSQNPFAKEKKDDKKDATAAPAPKPDSKASEDRKPGGG